MKGTTLSPSANLLNMGRFGETFSFGASMSFFFEDKIPPPPWSHVYTGLSLEILTNYAPDNNPSYLTDALSIFPCFVGTCKGLSPLILIIIYLRTPVRAMPSPRSTARYVGPFALLGITYIHGVRTMIHQTCPAEPAAPPPQFGSCSFPFGPSLTRVAQILNPVRPFQAIWRIWGARNRTDRTCLDSFCFPLLGVATCVCPCE